MPSWTNTCLAVTYATEDGSATISPINACSFNVTHDMQPVNSIERTHIGYVAGVPSMTFNMTVSSIGTVAASLTRLALDGTRFDIVTQEEKGEEWTLRTRVMTDCVITSASESIPIGGVPSMTFSGTSLATSVEAKAGGSSVLPAIAGG